MNHGEHRLAARSMFQRTVVSLPVHCNYHMNFVTISNSKGIMKTTISCITLITTLLLVGCDSATEPASPKLVIEGYLLAGGNIDSVKVSETVGIDRAYEGAAISGARVEISVDGQVLSLVEYPSRKGVYHYAGSHVVTSGKTYALRVEHGGRVATAQTTIPEMIEYLPTTSASLTSVDTVQYLSSEVFLDWTPIARRYFVCSFVSTDSMRRKIERALEDPHADEEDEPDIAVILAFKNETSATVPWIVYNYYGEYSLKIYAADDAFYNFARSKEQDRISLIDPLYNVNGGIGVFGSASVAELKVYVKQ